MSRISGWSHISGNVRCLPAGKADLSMAAGTRQHPQRRNLRVRSCDSQSRSLRYLLSFRIPAFPPGGFTTVFPRWMPSFSVHGLPIFFPPLPGFAGRTGSRTFTRCGTAPSVLLPCSGGAVCPEKANPEGNRKRNGRVFRTHAHYDVEQIAASVPLICPRHAAFIGFRNFICSYICRPSAPRMPHGFIIGCVGFVPALRIPPCPVLSSGAPVGRRPCAP